MISNPLSRLGISYQVFLLLIILPIQDCTNRLQIFSLYQMDLILAHLLQPHKRKNIQMFHAHVDMDVAHSNF